MGKNKKKNSETDEEYVVEDILDIKVKNGKRLYKIKWEGYPVDECTWEPASNLSSSLIKKYEKSVSKKIPFVEVSSDEISSSESSVDEPEIKEILESRKRSNGLEYRVKMSDGTKKWLPFNKIDNETLIETFNTKEVRRSNRKRVETFSVNDNEDVTPRKRTASITILDSPTQSTPSLPKNGSLRGSYRNSRVLAKTPESIIGNSFDALFSASKRSSKSKSITPFVSKLDSNRNSLSRMSNSSKESKSVLSNKSSSSQKEKDKKKIEDDEKEEDMVYTVEKIVDSRIVDGVEEFRVRWENYPPEEDTWQRIESFDDLEFVNEYKRLASKEFGKVRSSNHSTEKAGSDSCNFLHDLMKGARKGVTYRDEEIFGILDKHYDEDGEGYYLARLTSKEIIYIHHSDIPVILRNECACADRKWILNNRK